MTGALAFGILPVRRGDNYASLVRLHKKYRGCLRFGPSPVSIRNLTDVNKIYGLKSRFSKFLSSAATVGERKATQTILTSLDEAFHAKIKRPITNAYSINALTDYESLVGLVSRLCLSYWTRVLCRRDETVLSWSGFNTRLDAIGEITCSETFGFLDQGHDIDEIIESLNTAMEYNAKIGHILWLGFWLKKNLPWAWMTQPTGAVAGFARGRLMSRLEESREQSLAIAQCPQERTSWTASLGSDVMAISLLYVRPKLEFNSVFQSGGGKAKNWHTSLA
ncbi:hypothetical protein EDB81DRAFT_761341 [Dactylonectria macrodidyma]|uniref:Uncharacterized protein n=1 Tax=Dactylonectria macrodidyma TaxID=307937 RepID=A0A9P9EMK7_9HYPO|nr:hypothetical protein EDB81DRAFT_761341 [Dactylonectria macrodidyma]